MPTISRHTFQVAKLLAESGGNLCLMPRMPALHRLAMSLSSSLSTDGTLLSFIRTRARVSAFLLSRMLEADTLDDETGLQLEVVGDMFCSLPKGIRDEIESYIAARYNVYAVKKESA